MDAGTVKTLANTYGFVSYMLDFYGDDGIYNIGMTADEVLEGTLKLVSDYGSGTTFEGDSIDRERVRDIVLEMRKSTTHTHKMRPLDDSGSYECVSCEYQEIRGTTPESEV